MAIIARLGLLDNVVNIIAASVRLEYAVVQFAEALRRILKRSDLLMFFI
jgi:hypothetical protein